MYNEADFDLTNREVSVCLVGNGYNVMVGGQWLLTLNNGQNAERLAVALCLDSGINTYVFLKSNKNVANAASMFK